MPNYVAQSSTVLAVGIESGGPGVLVFNAEQPVVPQASQQVALVPYPFGNPAKFSVEVQFSGAPGAFEIDVQTSDTDVDAAYENYPVNGVINAVDANQRARAEFVNIAAKWVRLRLLSRANAVNLTARITR